MIDFSQFDSLIAMTMYFNNEAVCNNAIIETRWGIGDQQEKRNSHETIGCYK